VDLTQLLLLILIPIGVCITVIVVMIYRELKKTTTTLHKLLKNVEDTGNELLKEIKKLREDIVKTPMRSIRSAEIASSTRIREESSRSSNAEERESIWLDLSDPAVRQVYEYLKKKFEEEERGSNR